MNEKDVLILKAQVLVFAQYINAIRHAGAQDPLLPDILSLALQRLQARRTQGLISLGPSTAINDTANKEAMDLAIQSLQSLLQK